MMLKFKQLFTTLILIVSLNSISAQNSDCNSNLSMFAESVKMKDYASAYGPWKKVYDSCPTLNYATFAYADRILKDKIKKSSENDKKKYINLLMISYEKGYKYFPKKVPFAKKQMDKALLMYDFKLASKEEILKVLKEGAERDKNNFDNPKAVYLYFSTLVDLHKEGKRDLQEVFDTYDMINEAMEHNNEVILNKSEHFLEKQEEGTLTLKDKKRQKILTRKAIIYDKVSTSMNNKLGQLADCKNLIPLYTKNFALKKNDKIWLERAAARMDDKGCTDAPLFIRISEQLYKLNPSAKSAYYVALLKDKKGQGKEAIKFYNEAVRLEKDKYKKSKILLKIASKYKNQNQNQIAYNYAKKSIVAMPSYGDAYLFIASIYADSANECGSTSFEKRAIYWKAEEMAEKAARVQPSGAKGAKKAAYSYKQRAPQKADIFQADMAGKTITLSCWIGGTIKVPNL